MKRKTPEPEEPMVVLSACLTSIKKTLRIIVFIGVFLLLLYVVAVK